MSGGPLDETDGAEREHSGAGWRDRAGIESDGQQVVGRERDGRVRRRTAQSLTSLRRSHRRIAMTATANLNGTGVKYQPPEDGTEDRSHLAQEPAAVLGGACSATASNTAWPCGRWRLGARRAHDRRTVPDVDRSETRIGDEFGSDIRIGKGP